MEKSTGKSTDTGKLFPTYEVGSLPKLPARVSALKGREVTTEELQQLKGFGIKYGVDSAGVEGVIAKLQKEKRKPTSEERKRLLDFNAWLNIRIQEKSGIDFVYDGEARRSEMYRHVVQQVDGFEDLPEMVRSQEEQSYRKSVCIAEPKLKQGALNVLVEEEFAFVNLVRNYGLHKVKIPIDDPYMVAVMSDNRYYTRLARKRFPEDVWKQEYQAKRDFTLVLAKDIIRPQVKAAVSLGAQWIQLDLPVATVNPDHIPIVVEGINAVVENIPGEDLQFSLHFCYPRRNSLTTKNGYELLYPHVLNLNQRVKHFSLELANADTYEQDLAVFAQYQEERKFDLGVGVIDITLGRQRDGLFETPPLVRDRIIRAAQALKDPTLIYVAPDCGMRQLSLERCIRLYETMVEGAELARKG